MTDYKHEQVSALMDGELDPAAADRLMAGGSIKDVWARYHMISDVLHKRTPHASPVLAAKISELIKNEPAILAPTGRKLAVYLKPLAGMAVAASVAALAILGVQHYRPDLSTPAQEVAQTPLPGNPPARELVIPVQQAGVESPKAVQPELESNAQVNRYILNHNEYQSNAGVQGVVPYVRLVTTDEDPQPQQ